MAIDYAEKEREFLDSLAEDTGRDLAGWMTAIREAKLDDRNAIIDWLRRQGFLFARASWLERIHHNGGRPIYFAPTVGVDSAAMPRGAASPALSSPVAAPPAATAPHFTPAPVALVRKPIDPQAPPPRPIATRPAGLSLEAVLAEAKGYRPLAQFVLRAIEEAAPALSVVPRAGYIALCAGQTVVGILTVSPKELRLALAGAAGDPLDGFTRAKFARTHADIPPSMTHMVVLTDARQVTAELMAAVAGAAAADRAAPLPD